MKTLRLDLERPLEQITEQLMRVQHRFPDLVTLENFEEKVKEGKLQVFPIRTQSVMVGQRHEDSVRIVAAAGLLQDILDFLPVFCHWYKRAGCTTATLGGRRGWSKYLIGMGWKHGDYDGELVKDLSDVG